jgi:DNA-directed RNA polymerase specialized sigma24 family protein
MYASTEQRSRERVQVLADQLCRERYHYLLRIATKNTANAEDAADAVQFAFSAFLDKFDPDCEAPPLAWLTTTVKRAAWAIYRSHHLDRRAGQEAEAGGTGPGVVVDAIPSRASGPEQLVAQVDEARAKLASLKPAERRALSLLATGYSYAEIGELNRWTYTKVNRCISEGRAALRAVGAAA